MKHRHEASCCVGVNIQHAIFIIALLSFVGSCILVTIDVFNFNSTTIQLGNLFSYVYFTLWQKAYYHVVIDIALNSAWAISSVFLLYGNIRLRAAFYWPYIAVTYLSIGVYVIKIPLFMLAAFAVFKDDVEEVPKGGRIPTCIQIILLICLNFMFLIINWYTARVVTKGREFLLRHRQVRTKSMRTEMRNAALHLDGYHAPLDC